jgi:hypothetical protein
LKCNETFEIKTEKTKVDGDMKGRIFADEEVVDYIAFRDAVRDYICRDIREGRDHIHGTLLSEAIKKPDFNIFRPK